MRERSNYLKSVIIVAMSVLFLIVVVLSGYFLSTSPIAFQKATAIKFVKESTLILSKPAKYVDIHAILNRIPYKKEESMVYDIEPQQKYNKTILKGYGNCANLSFGLAYHLGKENHEYQIIHFMPPDGFLVGKGHTVVNTPYIINDKKFYGIVDILEGGLPQNNNLFVDIDSLRAGGFQDASIFSLNPGKDTYSPYYGQFLENSILGIVKSEEVEAYFNFIENIYMSLGNKKYEKIFYDGLSIVFGFYPRIYVLEDASDLLFKDNIATRIMAITLLASIRIFLFLFIFIGAIYIFLILINRKQKCSPDLRQ